MTDLLHVSVDEAYSFDRAENDTKGFVVFIQIGPLVLELWFTVRKFW